MKRLYCRFKDGPLKGKSFIITGHSNYPKVRRLHIPEVNSNMIESVTYYYQGGGAYSIIESYFYRPNPSLYGYRPNPSLYGYSAGKKATDDFVNFFSKNLNGVGPDKAFIDEVNAEIQGFKKVVSNKPKRNTRINEDDVINLKIALESSKSFDEFLEMV